MAAGGHVAPGPAPQLPPENFAARRAAVAAGLEAPLVISTHPEALFANDVHHRFRPQSDYWYLTGHQEPGGILVLWPTGDSDLFLHPRDPQYEIWNGRRLGLEGAKEVLGVERVHSREEFGAFARDHLAAVAAITEHDAWTHRRVRRHTESTDGRAFTAAHRVIKDADEIALLQRACDVTVESHLAATSVVRPGGSEHEVEASLWATWRAEGSTGPGYPPIVGAGDNASILHYIDNQAPIQDGDLVLIDAGCEWGYYTGDVTRTHIAGKPDEDQEAFLDIVAEAQAKAIATVAPGVRLRDVHDAACRVLAEGMVEHGVLDGPVEDVLDDQRHRAYYMHGTSHFLGLDVHDAGSYKDEDGKSIRLRPGMVITVEPGIYFNPDFAPCPAHLAGMGIRLEDDILVTDDGHRNLTGALPTTW